MINKKKLNTVSYHKKITPYEINANFDFVRSGVCQLRDLDFDNNWNIGHIDKKKIQKTSMRFFLFAKKTFFVPILR